MSSLHAVRLCHLYPDIMNIYADRGNIAVFRQRLAWRNMQLDVTNVGLGDEIVAGQHDLYYLGGGQDRDQNLVAKDLVRHASVLQAAANAGAAQLYVCGGIQLAGHSYTTADRTQLPGLGILDLTTEAGESRLIGDLIIDAKIQGTVQRVVGYENHVGRTRLGPTCVPLGRVISGHGNDGQSGYEGAVTNHVIGTYLHGPLLPKNPWIADLLLGWALEHRYGVDTALRPLEDAIEARAHEAAIARAGVKR